MKKVTMTMALDDLLFKKKMDLNEIEEVFRAAFTDVFFEDNVRLLDVVCEDEDPQVAEKL